MVLGERDFIYYSMEDYFEDCIEGKIMSGPFFEHVVEYWKQSLERPVKVLFLKYEDLKADPVCHVKRIAEFVGMPFSSEEENEGAITDIIKLCSINSLKELDINKNGISFSGLETLFLAYQKHFHARDSDLIIASLPKTGTTWLISLLFSIVNRAHHLTHQSPVLNHDPHDLVYSLENGIYNDHSLNYPRPNDLNDFPSPRLLSTHIPYSSQPESIKTSECRILFITRNPLDSIVSQWHFFIKLLKMEFGDLDVKHYSVEDYFQDFIEGKILDGPFFEHVIQYWKQSLERPEKVLFLQYEDLKDDPVCHMKRIAKFVGMPFSHKEENEGVIRDIIKLCSINNLKELNVNKNGVNFSGLKSKDYFRKGEVGDWTNYFTPSMVEKMNKLMQEKLEGTRLTFKLLPNES